MNMPASSLIVKLACLALPALLLPALHGAGEQFRLIAESVEIAERGKVPGYALLVDGKRMSFLSPAGWSVKPDAAKKTVQLLPEDLRAGIRIKIVLEENGGKPELKAEQLRQKVLERYPGAKITHEFRCYTSGEEGLAFDIERLVEEKIAASARIAFVTFDGGTVEFELTANTKTFADYHLRFGALLSSFRIGPAASKSANTGRVGGSR